MNIQQDVSLQSLNTLGLPSVARFFIAARTDADIEQANQFANEQGLTLLVLGQGSNIVLPAYLDAVVLQLEDTSVTVEPENEQSAIITTSAGVNWHALVEDMLNQGWHGLENLALIPGTVGAAPVQNIGAYGVELDQLFVGLRAYDCKNKQWVKFDKAACSFGYRDSLFKQAGRQRYVITEVSLRLNRQAVPNAGYKALAEELKQRGITSPQPRDVFDAVVAIRRSKLPDPSDIANAGSFFKNPIVTGSDFERLKLEFPHIPHYPQGEGAVKLAAGWLIEQAGYKGKVDGSVGMHDKQALVLVNHGGASSDAVKAFASQVKQAVSTRFGVALEQEPLQVSGDGRW